jgi:hypothetical protein
MEASVRSYITFTHPTQTVPSAYVDVSAIVQVSCDSVGTTTAIRPRIEVFMGAKVVVGTSDESGFFGGGYYEIGKYLSTHPPVYCLNESTRVCGGGPAILRLNYMDTPLTIDVSGSTTSLGEYSSGEAGAGPQAALLKTWCEDILDNLSATFRITSRDNCLPVVDCDCESNTDGLTLAFQNGPFTSPDYGLFLFDGDTELQTFSDLGAYYTLFYQPSANEWVIVMEQNNLSNTEIQFRWTVRVFCEAVPSGIPSPFRWYYSEEVECFEWEGGSITKNSKDTYVGHFNCEEDPCGTNGRAAGDLYPVGTPRDVEYLGRTTPDGYEPCSTPVAVSDFRIINDAECP